MKTLKDVLTTKGRLVYSVSPEETVFDVMRLMNEKGVGALLVMDEAGRLSGIVSERDVARKITLDEKPARLTPCSEIMVGDVACGRPDLTIQEAMAIMTETRIRHLPVIDGQGQVVGVVSIGDLVKAVIDEQEFVISQLTHYVSS